MSKKKRGKDQSEEEIIEITNLKVLSLSGNKFLKMVNRILHEEIICIEHPRFRFNNIKKIEELQKEIEEERKNNSG